MRSYDEALAKLQMPWERFFSMKKVVLPRLSTKTCMLSQICIASEIVVNALKKLVNDFLRSFQEKIGEMTLSAGTYLSEKFLEHDDDEEACANVGFHKTFQFAWTNYFSSGFL